MARPHRRAPALNVYRDDVAIGEVGAVESIRQGRGSRPVVRRSTGGRFSIEFPEDDYRPRDRHLIHLFSAASLLDMQAESITSAKQPAELRALIQAMWHLAAALDGEPDLHSQTSRINHVTRAVRRVERSLALGAPLGDLKSLQGAFLAEARTDYFTPGVRGERAAMERFRQRIEAGELAAVDWPLVRRSIGGQITIGPPPPATTNERVLSLAEADTFLPANFARPLEYTTAYLKAVEPPQLEQLAAAPEFPYGSR